jgi:hypothetical protein
MMDTTPTPARAHGHIAFLGAVTVAGRIGCVVTSAVEAAAVGFIAEFTPCKISVSQLPPPPESFEPEALVAAVGYVPISAVIACHADPDV